MSWFSSISSRKRGKKWLLFLAKQRMCFPGGKGGFVFPQKIAALHNQVLRACLLPQFPPKSPTTNHRNCAQFHLVLSSWNILLCMSDKFEPTKKKRKIDDMFNDVFYTSTTQLKKTNGLSKIFLNSGVRWNNGSRRWAPLMDL